jgi:hypothetical protein
LSGCLLGQLIEVWKRIGEGALEVEVAGHLARGERASDLVDRLVEVGSDTVRRRGLPASDRLRDVQSLLFADRLLLGCLERWLLRGDCLIPPRVEARIGLVLAERALGDLLSEAITHLHRLLLQLAGAHGHLGLRSWLKCRAGLELDLAGGADSAEHRLFR